MSSPARARTVSSLTPLEAHLRAELLALAGLTAARLARIRAEATAAGVPELRLLHAAGTWLTFVTTVPLTDAQAAALADAVTATIRRPSEVRVLPALFSTAGDADASGAWARAVPLW
jgi:hypothetical protein